MHLNKNIMLFLEPEIPHLFIDIPKYPLLNPKIGRQFGSAAFSEESKTKVLKRQFFIYVYI